MKILSDWIKTSQTERQNHIDLSIPCLERGGNSTVHQGVLAQFLDTDIPFKRNMKIHLCHACNNDKCSEPKHIYFGTAKENYADGVACGRIKCAYYSAVKKYADGDRVKYNKSLEGRIPWNKGKKNASIV